MKTKALLLSIMLLPCVVWARTWTDSQGRTLEADYVSAAEGKVTVRRDADAQVLELELSKLSESDREFVLARLAQEKRQAEIDASRVRLQGVVMGICTTGIIVECSPERQFAPRADRLTRIGGGTKQTASQPAADAGPVRVIGTFFIRDYPGKEKLNDYDKIDVEAYPAGQVASYTLLDGTKVLEGYRAYALQPAK